MAGYSCAPMRVQTWKYSSPAYCATEMVSATHLVNAKSSMSRYIFRDPNEGPICFQLSGNNSDTIARATKMITDLIAPEVIELNCGCPVTKVRAKNAGSKLLTQTEKLSQIIREMKNNTDAIITVKMRVEGDVGDHDNKEVAQLVEDAGADTIIVHGRHWTERYDGPCRYDQIAEIIHAVTIPVIGNGDVEDYASLKIMFEKTQCAGAMISRAAIGQPWIFAQLEAEALGEDFLVPKAAEVGSIFIDHISRLAVLEGEYRAILQARKIAKYYARDLLENKTLFLENIMSCDTLNSLEDVVKLYFAV